MYFISLFLLNFQFMNQDGIKKIHKKTSFSIRTCDMIYKS